MIRCTRIGQFATLLMPESGCDDRVKIKDGSGGKVEFDRQQIGALRRELAAAARELRRADERRQLPEFLRALEQ